MNPYEPSEQIEDPPAENLTGVFVWVTIGALFLGSLPYLYPAGST